VSSKENLQQDKYQADHKDQWKNMPFHTAGLLQKSTRINTGVNTSLMVFCNLPQLDPKSQKGLINIVKKPILAVI